MFERYTERARQVVVLAQDEARALKHNYIGTEHILLGLLREEQGLAARVLDSLDITVEEVRRQVARIVGQGDEVTHGQIPFTPRAKKILELSLREALSIGHNHIGTEHILLGLVRENEGVAARVLLDFDADAEKIRNTIIEQLSGTHSKAKDPAGDDLLNKMIDKLASGVDTHGERYNTARHLQLRLAPLVKASENAELIEALEQLTRLACTPFDQSDQRAS